MASPDPARSRAAIFLAPGEGRPYPMGRIAALFKADGGETQGAYSNRGHDELSRGQSLVGGASGLLRSGPGRPDARLPEPQCPTAQVS